jgi:MEMO1 family protein
MGAVHGAVRKPAVAGSFYPADEADLRSAIHDCYLDRLGPGRLPSRGGEGGGPEDDALLKACICPHAGYVYSGAIAAHSYLHLSGSRDAEDGAVLAIVVGPNHYGIGSGIATYGGGGEWETPLGRVSIDEEASKRIVELTGFVDMDAAAHRKEHSIEVQLPFLQDLYGGSLELLPISLAFQDESTARDLGKGLAELLKEEVDAAKDEDGTGMMTRRRRRTVLIASSDLTHYEPAAQAIQKDTALLECIQRMDIDAFYTTLETRSVTACGYGAIATVMEACRRLGLRKGRLNAYATSGDVTGDMGAVVGYPSVTFLEP